MNSLIFNLIFSDSSSYSGEDNLGYGTCNHKDNGMHSNSSSFILQHKEATESKEISISHYSINSIDSIKNVSKTTEDHREMTINYSIFLNEKNKTLVLNVLSIDNVHYSIGSATRTPHLLAELNIYVKIELSSSNQIKKFVKKSAKTRLIKSTLNPIFDETFEFSYLKFLFDTENNNEDSGELKLLLSVCNSNPFGRDQLIGEIVQDIARPDAFNNENGTLYLKQIFSKNINLVDKVCQVY